ncbi:MAG: glucans biosynthesis glucosyltransferase MdoH [Rhodobacteraceae bacterium]|nr:glucans biosynthesis glucosyltransferase MdoH [Paracoccaceae bacterium]
MFQNLLIMPPKAPLAMPIQNFAARFRDGQAPGPQRPRDVALWRILSFSPATVATFGLIYVMHGWFASDGLSWLEIVLLVLIGFNFFWICLTVSTVALGLVSLSRQTPQRVEGQAKPMKVALLMPVYNEVPWYVLGNAKSILEELREKGKGHHYAVFVLSDTRDEAIAVQEQAAVAAIRESLSPGLELYYRRREENTDRKVGNIADWVVNWGADWDAMLVLDADSLMTGDAIAELTDSLARDPSAGLIQSFPQLIGAQSVFARMQQFANGVYGAALAEGMARWCGEEGNYWGHNAIIRTRAFAASAGLPRVKGLRGGGLIMSHDFVEAGLLRRAGWGVRFLPRIRGSYEETPQTLIDHIQRDRRWCQGNLQHLRLLGARGLSAMSRFHLFHGAMGYLMSPIWFALLVMWALIGVGEEKSVLTYFSPSNPLFPTWPDMEDGRHVLVIVLVYAMLLLPKLMGIGALRMTGDQFSQYGGVGRFGASFVTEVCLSVIYAPVLMVQQMIAVFRTAFGLQKGWSPQTRDGGHYSLRTLLQFHALETVSGLLLMLGIVTGFVSVWLMPIGLSLALAVPLSALSGFSFGRRPVVMGTREEYVEPAITRAARHYRAELKSVLDGTAVATPAE